MHETYCQWKVMCSINTLASQREQPRATHRHTPWTLPLKCLPCKQFSNPNWVRKTVFLSAESSPSVLCNKNISAFPTFKLLIAIHMQTLKMAQASPEARSKGQPANTWQCGCPHWAFLCRAQPLMISLWYQLCPHTMGIWKPPTEFLRIKWLAWG